MNEEIKDEPKFELELEKVIPAVEAVPEKVEVKTYDRAFIEKQVIAITNDLAYAESQVTMRKTELAECQSILDEMDKQGIVNVEVFNKEVEDASGPEEIIII